MGWGLGLSSSFSLASEQRLLLRPSLPPRPTFCFGATAFTLAQPSQIALVHGTAIDPADGRTISDATVLIEGDKIVALGSPNETRIAPEAKQIDCTGKFILPGYIDTHATELEAARAAVEEGADLLVHSVTDKPVDDAVVRLMRERGTMLTPTLLVFERYGRTFANKLNLTPEEKTWGNPEVIATLDVTKLPEDKVPDRIKTALANPESVLARIQETYAIALKNLKTLEDAGIPIAAGTDAGNIGTIHGRRSFENFS